MLNAAQHAARAGKITGTRIKCLMEANRENIMRMYREFLGEELPEDLSHVWPVRLGEATEQLQLDWYEEKQQRKISRRGEVVLHWNYPWAAATLDGWIDELECPIECKHVGGREPFETIVARYQPQLQWQMEVTGADECALSVIVGADEPKVQILPRDATYAEVMIARAMQFMHCVKHRIPPVELPAVPAPVDAIKIYNMDGDNQWAASARDWLETRAATEANAEAAKILKALVPADAKKCLGYGVYIVRDTRGYLSLREGEGK